MFLISVVITNLFEIATVLSVVACVVAGVVASVVAGVVASVVAGVVTVVRVEGAKTETIDVNH